MNIVLAHNPRSGSAKPLNELTTLFNDAGITLDTTIDITSDSATDTIKQRAVQGATIAAIGGDGTLSSVAQHLINTPAIFIPLPGGTLNHFTKDAGITQDLTAAIAAIRTAKPRPVDVAMVNDRVFLNNSSIGIYPSSLRTRKQFEDKLGKWPAAVVGSIRAYLKFELYSVTINEREFKTPFLFIGNNNYNLGAGGVRTSLNGGVLSVYAVTSTSRRGVLKLLFAAVTGYINSQPDLMSFTTKKLTLRTARPSISVSTDGEVERIKTPLTYEILPGKLTIIGNS